MPGEDEKPREEVYTRPLCSCTRPPPPLVAPPQRGSRGRMVVMRPFSETGLSRRRRRTSSETLFNMQYSPPDGTCPFVHQNISRNKSRLVSPREAKKPFAGIVIHSNAHFTGYDARIFLLLLLLSICNAIFFRMLSGHESHVSHTPDNKLL